MLRENQISDLINQSGRLRMLSHRAAMLLSFLSVEQDEPWFLDELQETIRRFNSGVSHIREMVEKDPLLEPGFNTMLSDTSDGEKSAQHAIEDFSARVSQLSSLIRGRRSIDSLELSAFLKFVATDLLRSLNQIVGFFESTLNDRASERLAAIEQLGEQIHASILEVDQINLKARILSLNASVEAARAGDAGRGFAVVSKEMNSLSDETRRVTDTVKKTVSSFVEHISEE